MNENSKTYKATEHKATEKSKGIDDFLKGFTHNGKSRQELLDDCECATCKNPNLDFRNQISEKEYTISGMCQSCQDVIFGKD